MNRRSPPDTRLSHHDPAMPVYRAYRFADGSVMEWAPPDYEQRLRAHYMTNPNTPNWRDDPTYHMNRKAKS